MTLPNPLTGKKSKWMWSESKGLYVYKTTGRAVSPAVIGRAFDKVIKVSAKRMNTLTALLNAGKIPLATWQQGMATQVKLLHMSASASARGGWARMSTADWKYANSLTKTQLKYLKGFAKDIRTKKQALGDGSLYRSRLYADAGRGTYEQVHRKYEMENNGKTEERLVLGVADHCPGCLNDAGLGFVPIGTLAPIGSRNCVVKCHCHFEYR